MATSMKKKLKPKKRVAVKAKAKNRKAGKKTTSERVLKDIRNEMQLMEAPRAGANPEPIQDPGHSPGHKKMSVKNQPFAAFAGKIQGPKKTVMSRLTESEKIHKNVVSHRSTKRG